MSEGRVLVVDDNPIVLDVLRALLGAEGFQVETEESVFRMSDAIRRHRPEVILLDVKMPAVGGVRAAAILQQRKFSQDIPVLFFSDLDPPDLERLAGEAGVAGFVSKTTEKEHLLEVLRQWVGKSAPSLGESEPVDAAPKENEVVLRSHLQPLLAAGGSLLLRMIEAFEQQLTPRLESLRRAAAAGEVSKIVEDTHFLKGSSRALGAVALTRLLEAAERQAEGGQTPTSLQIEQMSTEGERVRRALREIVEEQSAPTG